MNRCSLKKNYDKKLLKNISKSLRVIRALNNLSQMKAAEKLGIAFTTYNSMENGHRMLSVQRLIKISKKFGHSMDDIVKGLTL